MELNWILVWLCGVSSAINLVMTLPGRREPLWGWRIVLAAILLLLAAAWIAAPDIAGYLVGPVWFVFALLPGLLMRRVNRLLSLRKHRRAWWLARLAGWLHPFDGWPQQAELVRALALFEQGRTDAAAAIIRCLGNEESFLGRTARLIQAQQTGDWQSLLDWIDRRYSAAVVEQDDALLIARVQALGELGRTGEMLQAVRPVLERGGDLHSHSRAVLQMRVAALSGQVRATQRQLSALMQTYPADVHRYWQLTAQQVAGVEGVAEEFRDLQTTAGSYLQPMIARRRSHPLPVVGERAAEPEAAAVLSKLADAIEHDATYAIWMGDDRRRPWATWGIALVLIGSFIREMMGDGALPPAVSLEYLAFLIGNTLDPDNLVDLGALIVPQSYTPGEWWRVLTAGFLHFGPLHLGLNLLGLLLLAPRLERAWGALPTIVCYLTTTVTSMALAPHVMSLADGPPFRILVGASGGVMGLLGGLVGFLLVGWFQHRTDVTRRPLLFLLLIIVLQTAFDLSTPNVSFACHALGLASGMVFGVVWTWRSRRAIAKSNLTGPSAST
jgi:rhomboid protease GluP